MNVADLDFITDTYKPQDILSLVISGLSSRNCNSLVDQFLKEVEDNRASEDPKLLAPIAVKYLKLSRRHSEQQGYVYESSAVHTA